MDGTFQILLDLLDRSFTRHLQGFQVVQPYMCVLPCGAQDSDDCDYLYQQQENNVQLSVPGNKREKNKLCRKHSRERGAKGYLTEP